MRTGAHAGADAGGNMAGPQRYFSDVFWHFPGSPDIPRGFWPKKPGDIHERGLKPKPPAEGVGIVGKIAESENSWRRAPIR
jgi:hypothetical protein